MESDIDKGDCFVVEGKLALPYTYFAGRVGSKFITAKNRSFVFIYAGLHRGSKADTIILTPHNLLNMSALLKNIM